MTYKELLDRIKEFTPAQMAMDVTLYDLGADEFCSVVGIRFSGDIPDVLDPHHPYIAFNPTDGF